MTNEISKLTSKSWIAESLRFTLFSFAPINPKEHNYWELVLNEPPEQEIGSPKTGVVQQNGPWENGLLDLVVQPSRVDWTWRASQDLDIDKFPTVGPLDESSKKFESLLNRWLEHCPAASRIAFGVISLLPADSLSEGLEFLARSTGLDIDLEGASDVMFQLNRPRPTKTDVAELKINRLANWSMVRFQKIQLQIGASSKYSNIDEAIACRLVLDVNTSPDFSGDLSKNHLRALCAELQTSALEIAEKGDCK